MPPPTTTFTYRVESDKPLLATVARMYVTSMAGHWGLMPPNNVVKQPEDTQ